ncbi:diacylglycerol kinase family protein [Halosquirtibacter xylanolyticus]|uniref:diacylglycerol kinase family protein n=1 Tax=Halosquirtibacter xylanolyticus TaxID=3374599 RepID=UPI00374A6AB0|nr:diacylglycerol kinase family protein [Prolixibacteraceae bacterium]
MKQQNFSLSKRLESFKYAFNGLRVLIKEEHNARIHLFATILVVAAGFYYHISIGEWIAILLCIGLVISLEIINSAIENIADYVSPNKHEMIKKIKDLSAASVLVTAFISLIIGILIFIDKIF